MNIQPVYLVRIIGRQQDQQMVREVLSKFHKLRGIGFKSALIFHLVDLTQKHMEDILTGVILTEHCHIEYLI